VAKIPIPARRDLGDLSGFSIGIQSPVAMASSASPFKTWQGLQGNSNSAKHDHHPGVHRRLHGRQRNSCSSSLLSRLRGLHPPLFRQQLSAVPEDLPLVPKERPPVATSARSWPGA